MNSVNDLRDELRTLADRAPSDADVRAALTDRIDARAKRRRTQALIAVAAAVVVVAGGIGITASMLSHRSVGPAGPQPVVTVPEVPLPPDTKLIRHQLQPVTSPVTATPPKALTGQVWSSSPGRLAVSWFDKDRGAAFGWVAYSSSGRAAAAGPAAAGYVITSSKTEPLTVAGDPASTTPSMHSSTITVDGHAATLETAPTGTTDQMGFPAEQRISWQLGEGRWIHVWAEGLTPVPGALESFAAGITEQPQILDRSVGIGLTLPGLSVDSSMNASVLSGASVGSSVFLCPPGIDPLAGSYSSSSGSSGGTTIESNSDPTQSCITAGVVNYSIGALGAPLRPTVTVGDTVAQVDAATGRAIVDLGGGLLAVVAAPSAHLSAQDLAALAASVRLSPAVQILPMTPAQQSMLQGSEGSGVATAVSESAMAEPAQQSASAELPQVPAPTAQTSLGAPSGTLVGAAPAVFTVPFALKPGNQHGVAWKVTPSSGRVDVNLMNDVALDGESAQGTESVQVRESAPTSGSAQTSPPVQANGSAQTSGSVQAGGHGDHSGSISYGKFEPTGVPASAQTVTVSGHDARMWTDGSTSIAWALPDGIGIIVSGDTEASAHDLAAMIGVGSTTITAGAAPTLLPGGLVAARLETAGLGTATQQPAATMAFCPAGIPAGTELDDPHCLRVTQYSANSDPGTVPQELTSWRVTKLDSATVYISPDGLAATRIGADQMLATVAVSAEMHVTAADLVTILLSIPG